MAKISIVYGSGGGNTELVCEKVAEVFEEKNHAVRLHRTENAGEEILRGSDLLIFASPTYGHGMLEKYMGKFLRKVEGIDLKRGRCAVIGLGDDKYDADYHMESARLLEKFVSGHNGHFVWHTLCISKSPVPILETTVKKWAEGLERLISNI